MAQLSLDLLGPVHITSAGVPINDFPHAKVRALLIYLAVEAGHPHHREALAELLWPNEPGRLASLRAALASLRKAIGDRTAARPYLINSHDTIQLNPASDVTLDVVRFRKLLDACNNHSHRHPAACRSCIQRFERAAELYRGDFLEDFTIKGSETFEDWARVLRERLHEEVLRALAHLTTHAEQRSAHEQAAVYARRQITLEPWCEEAYRQLMRALVSSGQRAAALAQYEHCRRVLAAEFACEPEDATVQLYEAIRKGTWQVHRRVNHDNLPAQTTVFIGRADELAMLADLLADPTHRLITLVGLGGIGKTRLALQVATEQLGSFADGVVFVPCAPLAKPDLLVPAIAQALDFTFDPRTNPRAQLLDLLQQKELLLVLDNLEHLLAAGELLLEIIQQAPLVTILATSREQLRVHGQVVMEIMGLQVPDDDQAENLEDTSAVQLFQASARRASAGFALTAANRAAAAQLCRLVEGMPLAIELAGSWARTLTCAEIVQAIARGPEMPNTTAQTLGMWPHAIMSVFDRSWRLLTSEEQQVLRRLAMFRGGCERAAAEEVAGATLPLLAALVDKSLLRRAATGRYELHELVRQYALEHLLAAGEHELVQNRHLHYYLALAEDAVQKLRGAEQQAWLDRLEREHDNLRAALRWSQTKRQRLEAGLRLVGALWWFWSIRGHLSEGRSWIEGLLRHESVATAEMQAHARAGALIGAGGLACFQGDFEVALARLEESLSLGQKLEDQQTMAYAEALLGKVAVEQGHPETARARAEQSLVLFQLVGDRWGSATTLIYLGWALTLMGDFAEGAARFEDSLAIYRELGDQRGILAAMGGLGEVAWLQGDIDLALVLGTDSLLKYQALGDKAEIAYMVVRLGDIALRQGDAARAEAEYNQGLALFQELGQKRGIAVTLQNLAQVALNRANPTAAMAALIESMHLFRDLGDPLFIARNLVLLAEATRALGQGQRAARLLGTAKRAWEDTGVPLSVGDKIDLEQITDAVRADVPEALFRAAWAEGHALTRDEAIAYVLSERS